MKKIMSCVSLLLLLLTAGCFQSSEEAAITEMLDCMNEMTDILVTVKDGTTAILAEPKLEKLGKRMDAAGKKMQSALMKAGPQKMQNLMMDYNDEMTRSSRRFISELTRVSCIPGVGEGLQDQLATLTTSGST